MNTKEIIDEINNEKKASFRIPLKNDEGRKSILVVIFKSSDDDIEQSYWMITNDIYEHGKNGIPGVDKIYSSELEDKIEYLNRITKKSQGTTSLTRFSRPEFEKIINKYYNDI